VSSPLSEMPKEMGKKLVVCDVCKQERPPWLISPNCHCVMCPDCKTLPMDLRGSIDPGDEEGRGDTSLYQCSQCKRVEVA
jgi:hypothetical protein